MIDSPVYCASDKAIAAATTAWWEATCERAPSGPLADALIAAHSADLGFDRSVCLRDVIDWLESQGPVPHGFVAAHWLRVVFGGEA